MSNHEIDLGKPTQVLGLGVGLKQQHCKCGTLLSANDQYGLCPICRAANGEPTIKVPMAVPTSKAGK
jgi:hypothetical protein